MAGAAAKAVAGAAVDEEARIEVTSLMGALESVLEVPAGRRTTVELQALEVQHAAALAEMLRFQTSRRRWKVLDYRKLKVFGSADSVLVILDDALLPILANEPTSLPALNLLERYANRLQTLSRSVGGTFEEEVDFLHDELIRHANEGRAKPLAVSVNELVARCNSIREHISALRDRVVGVGDENLLSDGDDDDGFEDGDD